MYCGRQGERPRRAAAPAAPTEPAGTELLEHDEDDFAEAAGPLYSKFSDAVRQRLPGPMMCRLFCGGARCKYDALPPALLAKGQAIAGIYSNWVTDEVLAMSRPSDALFDGGLIDRFVAAGITAVFNLQHRGEHEACCPGGRLSADGFSYTPDRLMAADIHHYNFGWQDYGAPTVARCLDMVKVMAYHTRRGGKVAVHCHAGLGRTGVLIALFLLFSGRCRTAKHAIVQVRARRAGAIQTHAQGRILRVFESILAEARPVFAPGNLAEQLRRQRHFLHGIEAEKYRRTPHVLEVLIARLATCLAADPEAALPATIEKLRASRPSAVLTAGLQALMHAADDARLGRDVAALVLTVPDALAALQAWHALLPEPARLRDEPAIVALWDRMLPHFPLAARPGAAQLGDFLRS